MDDNELGAYLPPSRRLRAASRQEDNAPSLLDVVRSRYEAKKRASVATDRIWMTEYDTAETQAHQRNLEAKADLAASRFRAEADLYDLAAERDRARLAYQVNSVRSLMTHDEAMQLLHRQRQQLEADADIARLEAQRRGYASGLLSPVASTPSAGLLGSGSNPVIEPSFSASELDGVAMRLWARLHRADPETRRELLAQEREKLADRMTPYDVSSVMGKVEELLKTHG